MLGSNDPELVKRLERSEMAAWGDFYRAASPRSINACGLHVSEPGGALVTLASGADVLSLNRVIGLGLGSATTENDIEALVDLFASRAVPRFFVQTSPIATGAGLERGLLKSGFRHHNNWVKLYRDVAAPPAVSTDLTVRQIDERDAARFGRMVAAGFGWPAQTAAWVSDFVGRAGWRHYMAFDGDQPVATGALHVQDDLAWVDFATTLPSHRGRGAQSALLAQRIRDAGELGSRRVVVETSEEVPEKPAPSFRNMISFGFQVAYLRPSYIRVNGARSASAGL